MEMGERYKSDKKTLSLQKIIFRPLAIRDILRRNDILNFHT